MKDNDAHDLAWPREYINYPTTQILIRQFDISKGKYKNKTELRKKRSVNTYMYTYVCIRIYDRKEH